MVRSLRKVLGFILVLIMMQALIVCCNLKTANAIPNVNVRNPIKIGVLLYDLNDTYISLLKKGLEDIQINNKNKVEFTFYDGKNNQAIQEATIASLYQTGKIDLLFADLVSRGAESVQNVIDKAKALNIPVVFGYLKPEATGVIKSYNKAFIIGADTKEAGDLQAKIIIDIWNSNKASIDKNNDNILQCIILHGSTEFASNVRPQYTLSTINSKIKTEALAVVNSNFNKELAKDAIKSLFLKYDGKIEAIIADNDAMAIGSIEALQAYGYNTRDLSKNIVVVGIDGILQARELIDKGYMAGTVIQDPKDAAEALYTVGMNLVSGKAPIEGTSYKLDETGTTVLLPNKEYTARNKTVS